MERGRETKTIGSLLDKYKKSLRAPQKTVVKSAISAIAEITGVSVDQRMISYNVHSRTLSVHAGGPLKTEILLAKQEVLARCVADLGVKNAPEHIV